MKHTILYDEEHQMVLQAIIGFFTTEETRLMSSQYDALLDGKPYRQLIVDLRKAGKMESRETRSLTNQLLNESKFTDVVFVGATAAQRMIAKVLMKLGSLKAESNFVKDIDGAINWLKNRRK
jgi:hypothetical protein